MPDSLIALPLAGLNSTDDGFQLEDGKSPDLLNVRSSQGFLEKRRGFQAFDTLSEGVPPYMNLPTGRTFIQASFETPPDPARAEQFLMLHGNKVFQWDPPYERWLTVTLPDFDVYGMGTYGRFGVCNTLNAVFATAWNAQLRIYDGVNYSFVPHDLERPHLSALTCLAFNNRVILVRTREGIGGSPSTALQFPARIRWCVNGNSDLWNPANSDGCGVQDIIESSNKPLTGGFVFNGRCFLTKEREIIELVATGSLEPVFRAQPRVSGVGMVAPHAWATAPGVCFFLGNDDVYRFDGAGIQGIGHEIFDEIAATITMANILDAHLNAVQFLVFPLAQELWIINGVDGRLWVFDYRNSRWFRDRLPTTILGMGVFDPIEIPAGGPAQAKESMVLSIADTFYVNAGSDSDSDLYGTIYGGHEAPHDPLGDRRFTGENIRVFESYASTKDLYPLAARGGPPEPTPERMNVLHRVIFQADPETVVVVGMSRDRGETWIEREVTTRPDGIGVAFFVEPYAQLRLRFRNSRNEPMRLRGAIKYTWKPAGVVLANG